jgi:hypothetical protein
MYESYGEKKNESEMLIMRKFWLMRTSLIYQVIQNIYRLWSCHLTIRYGELHDNWLVKALAPIFGCNAFHTIVK